MIFVKKKFGQKKIEVQKYLGSKKFQSKKSWSQKMLIHKNVPKKLGQ